MGRFQQTIHIVAPGNAQLSGGLFCISYPLNVALPGSGTVNGRVTNLPGLVSLADFNSGAQLGFTDGSQNEFDPVISFDLCKNQPSPSPMAFHCLVKQAENQGVDIDPSVIQCVPITPTPSPTP